MERAGLDHRDRVAVAVPQPQRIEYVLVEMQEREVEPVVCHRAGVFCEVRLYVGDRERIEFTVVQANAKFAIANDGIFVWVDVGALELGKSERFVEMERLDDVGRLHAQLEESPDRGHRSAPMATARLRAAGSFVALDQPAECCSTRPASRAT